MSETTHRSIRLALASLIATALAAQLLIGLSQTLTVVNFFSFFTVLSNTMAVVVLTMLAARPGRDAGEGFAMFRGAVTVYMSVTGLVYALILAPNLADVGVSEPWIDWVIHVLGPIAIALDWFIYPPATSLRHRSIPIWLAFPVVYVTYSLVRGSLTDWYPYPFLDPEETGGYGGVLAWLVVVLVVILGFGYLYRWRANRANGTTTSE